MFLGIEIGGTKLQLGLGPGTGQLAALWRGEVVPAAGAEGIRRQIIEAIPILLSQAQVDRANLRGVGIGFGGPVDDTTAAVIKSHQIAGWDHFPLAEWIGQLVDLPAALGNDADVAGLAEARFGAGQGYSPIFYMTIGSGIGGGLIIGGAIYRGFGRGAAEIGHLVINTLDAKGQPIRCILEHAASGWALGKLAQQQMAQHPIANSQMWQLAGQQLDRVTGHLVGQAAQSGDALALAILDQALDALAEGLGQMITLVAPRRIVIGGGVGQLGEQLFFEPLRRKLASRLFPPFAGCIDLVAASLGEAVVVQGALALAKLRVEAEIP